MGTRSWWIAAEVGEYIISAISHLCLPFTTAGGSFVWLSIRSYEDVHVLDGKCEHYNVSHHFKTHAPIQCNIEALKNSKLRTAGGALLRLWFGGRKWCHCVTTLLCGFTLRPLLRGQMRSECQVTSSLSTDDIFFGGTLWSCFKIAIVFNKMSISDLVNFDTLTQSKFSVYSDYY